MLALLRLLPRACRRPLPPPRCAAWAAHRRAWLRSSMESSHCSCGWATACRCRSCLRAESNRSNAPTVRIRLLLAAAPVAAVLAGRQGAVAAAAAADARVLTVLTAVAVARGGQQLAATGEAARRDVCARVCAQQACRAAMRCRRSEAGRRGGCLHAAAVALAVRVRVQDREHLFSCCMPAAAMPCRQRNLFGVQQQAGRWAAALRLAASVLGVCSAASTVLAIASWLLSAGGAALLLSGRRCKGACIQRWRGCPLL